MTLTDKQMLALECLRDTWMKVDRYVCPSEIGYAMAGPDGLRKDGSRVLKPQGAGRIGGSTAARLVEMKLARHFKRGYAITSAGFNLLPKR